MIRSPVLTRVLSSVVCRECRGSGKIVLFRSIQECDGCNGEGRIFGDAVMTRTLDQFNLSWRTRAAIDRLGLRTVADLTRLACDDVRRAQFADPIVVEEVDRLLCSLGVLDRN
jgi:RecJ-like exonuclease